MKQPTDWSCYPTAVSILTGIPLDKLLKVLGHDGSKIIDDKKPTPWCREAFVHEEMVIALHRFSWTATLICAALTPPRTNYPSFEQIKGMIKRWNVPTVAVIKKPAGFHCLAWIVSDDLVIDPMTGKEYIDEDFPVSAFEPLFRI